MRLRPPEPQDRCGRKPGGSSPRGRPECLIVDPRRQVWARKNSSSPIPLEKSFPKWTPGPLPATKEDGGLTVTLDKFSSAQTSSLNSDQDNPDDAINKGVSFAYHVEQNGKPVKNWEPTSIQTSDATGNSIYGGPSTQWQDNEGTTTSMEDCAPDEAAWKVRFEFSRAIRL